MESLSAGGAEDSAESPGDSSRQGRVDVQVRGLDGGTLSVGQEPQVRIMVLPTPDCMAKSSLFPFA